MFKRRPLEAWRALQRLIADPEDTGQVFVIMRALSGDALVRGTRRFERTPTGAAMLRTPHDLVATLSERGRLATLPEGSLGRAYLALVERAGITAQGLVEVSETEADEYRQLTDAQMLYAKRLRDAHDLWHTVTGYETDTLGEACVVAFSYGQTRNLGFAAIALIGGLKIAKESGDRRVLRAVWRAYRDGRRAQWLPAIPWEDLLDKPLEQVRQQLRIAAPARYRVVRNDWDAPVGQPA
jgi:ubiquinone biosynthesis protein COQ4